MLSFPERPGRDKRARSLRPCWRLKSAARRGRGRRGDPARNICHRPRQIRERFDGKTGYSFINDFRHSAKPQRGNRRAAKHGLDQYQAKGLRVLDWIHQRFRAAEKLIAFSAAHKTDVFGRFTINQRLDLLAKIGARRACHQQTNARATRGGDRLARPLDRFETAQVADVIFRRRSEGKLGRVHSMRNDRGWLKLGKCAPLMP